MLKTGKSTVQYSMTNRNILTIVTYLLMIALSVTSNGTAQEHMEIPDKMIQKWKIYCETATHLSTCEEFHSISQKEKKNIITRSFVNFPCLIIETDDKTTNTNHVHGFNQKYHFALSKRSDDSEWKIELLEKIDNVSNNVWDWLIKSQRGTDRLTTALRNSFLPLFVCGSVSVPEMITSKDIAFSIHNLNEENKLSPVVLEYKITGNNTASGLQYPFHSGKVFFDSNSYLVTRSETLVEENPEYKIILENEYEESTSKTPVLTKSMETVVESGKEVYTSVRSFQTTLATQFEHDRFTLSHYGIPEPDFVMRQNRFQTFRYLLMMFGAALILYSTYCIYQRRKLNAPRSSEE